MKPPLIALIFTAVVLGVVSCTDDGSDRPPIPENLIVDVLVDVYTVTARAHLSGADADSARVEAMARFGLDTTDLRRTLDYFAENPDSASIFYQGALDSLVILQRNLRSAPEIDSLRARLHG